MVNAGIARVWPTPAAVVCLTSIVKLQGAVIPAIAYVTLSSFLSRMARVE